MQPKLIVIAGTNASGKSALGVELALRYHGEIVSADSRQVFRGLDLGSGKITPAEMKGVPHHLIDVCEPNDFFSVADFQRMAYAAIDDIIARGKTPFLVGGTGLYIAAVVQGYVMSQCEPDLQYRAELEKLETPALYEMLRKLVPDVEVEPRNRNRVMRLLEKIHDGDTVAPTQSKRYDTLTLGVSWPRDILWQRILERIDRRLQDGMIEEVQGLLDRGATVLFMQKLGLEYRFITDYLQGAYASKEEMLDLLAIAIRQFAKRQMTWFRRPGQVDLWLHMDQDPMQEACDAIDAFLQKEE